MLVELVSCYDLLIIIFQVSVNDKLSKLAILLEADGFVVIVEGGSGGKLLF